MVYKEFVVSLRILHSEYDNFCRILFTKNYEFSVANAIVKKQSKYNNNKKKLLKLKNCKLVSMLWWLWSKLVITYNTLILFEIILWGESRLNANC